MVSVALVTAVSLVFASAKASFAKELDVGFDADLVISGDQFSASPSPRSTPPRCSGARTCPACSPWSRSRPTSPGSTVRTDLRRRHRRHRRRGCRSCGSTATDGSLELGPGEIILDDESAAERGLAVGDTVRGRAGPHRASRPCEWPGSTRPADRLGDPRLGRRRRGRLPCRDAVSRRTSSCVPVPTSRRCWTQVREAIKDSPDINVITVDQFVGGLRPASSTSSWA